MFNAAAVEKVGTVKAFGGSSAPDGWLFCDGSAISRTTYAALFAVIGTTYGAGDGTTTFNLPNSKILIGNNINVYGNGKALGITNGLNNFGLQGIANTGQQALGIGNGIGANVGSTGHTYTSATSGKSYGVVTSGESGVIADITNGINTIIKY